MIISSIPSCISPLHLSLLCFFCIIPLIYLTRNLFSDRKRLKVSFWIVVLLGTIVFFWGYSDEPLWKANWMMLFLRSFISSLEMFISETHLDEIAIEREGWLKGSEGQVYLAIFFAIYSLALTISFWAIFSVLGRRVTGYIWGFFNPGRSKQYIFIGVNKPACLVAESLEKSIMKKNEKGDILYISFAKQQSERFSFISLFQDSSDLDDYKKYLKMPRVFPAERQFFDGNKDNLKSLLSSVGLRWMIGRFSSNDTELFILGDDESENLRTLQALLKSGCTKPRIFCHAHRDGLVGLLSQSYPIGKIHFVDSSYLAVRELLKEEAKEGKRSHPVDYVEIAKDEKGRILGYTITPFNSMVLGFGETGQEAVKFLYEFGCFSDHDGNLQTANIYVVDRELKQSAGAFMHHHPGASYKNEVNQSGRIRFIQASIFDPDFNTFISSTISELNYIVVSLGNAQTNIEVGLDILNYALKYRKHGLNNFVVKVHLPLSISDKALEYQLIDVYNKNEVYKNNIQFFGLLDSVWHYKTISETDSNEKAKIFFEKYIIASGKPIHVPDKNGKLTNVWDKRLADLEDAINESNLKRIEDYRMKIEQDRHNYYHTYTKTKLGGIDKSNSNIGLAIPYEYSDKHYCASNDEHDLQYHYSVCEHLAVTEHLRWQCFNEMMGYVPSPDGNRDYLKKWHENMKPFKMLPEYVQHYDWITVKTVCSLCENEKSN